MKSEVYSWRVAPERKQALEEEARRAGVSLAELLEEITRDWLRARVPADEVQEQERLHQAVRDVAGSISSGQAGRSAGVRAHVRDRLARKRARET
jgi:hypothetical protein